MQPQAAQRRREIIEQVCEGEWSMIKSAQKKDGWNVIIHIQSYYIHNQKLPFMVNMVGLYYYFMVDLVLWTTEILRKHLRGSYMELPHPGGGAMGCLPCIIMSCSPTLSQLPSHKLLIPTPKIAKQDSTKIVMGWNFHLFHGDDFHTNRVPGMIPFKRKAEKSGEPLEDGGQMLVWHGAWLRLGASPPESLSEKSHWLGASAQILNFEEYHDPPWVQRIQTWTNCSRSRCWSQRPIMGWHRFSHIIYDFMIRWTSCYICGLWFRPFSQNLWKFGDRSWRRRLQTRPRSVQGKLKIRALVLSSISDEFPQPANQFGNSNQSISESVNQSIITINNSNSNSSSSNNNNNNNNRKFL